MHIVNACIVNCAVVVEVVAVVDRVHVAIYHGNVK